MFKNTYETAKEGLVRKGLNEPLDNVIPLFKKVA
jgi:hypothetical protein